MSIPGKLYYINVGKEGVFQSSGTGEYETSAADTDAIFSFLKKQGQKKLILYFHGGLVSTMSGLNTAGRIFDYVSKGTQFHPVSFVWETGLMETIEQNFDTIGKSEFFKKLLIKIIKVAGKKLGIDLQGESSGTKGVGSLTTTEINLELKKTAPFEDTIVDTSKRSPVFNASPKQIENEFYYNNVVRPEVQPDLEAEIMTDPELIRLAAAYKPKKEQELMKEDSVEIEADGSKGIFTMAALIKAAVTITVEVIKRNLKKRDHGFYPTIIEEVLREFFVADIGSWVWGAMKKKAKTMWDADDFIGDNDKWRAGSYFLKKLQDYQEDAGSLTIDLVGHSAGSIAICELLRASSIRYPKLKFRSIIFMAPACRCELFVETILAHTDQFALFRCFTMQDSYEKKDHLVPGLYPRSLLYLISGILEEKSFDAYILGLQRHIDANPPYNSEPLLTDIKNYLQHDSRIAYSVSPQNAIDGMRTSSEHHGDFDNNKESTMDSIVYLINH